MNAQVVCHVRAGVTLTFKLKEKDAVAGRDPLNAIALPIEGVSRHHAKIRWDGKAYWVEDLRSTNGTFLNGQTAMRERLKHLDVISLGREVDLVFLARAAEAPQTRQGIVRAALVVEGEGSAAVAISAGEVTLGRAATNNIVADSTAVSKVHARIERTLDQLVLEDLGSANGTYVNGARVMTAYLHDGDVLSLAGVETYRVVVEMGEVKGFSTSARMKAPVTPGERHRFAADWRTRFDWDSGEQKQLEEMRHQIRERDQLRDKQRERTNKVDVVKAPGHPARPATPAKGAAPAKPAVPAKPAAAGAAPAAAAAPAPTKPAAAPSPAPAKPEPVAKPAGPGPAPSAAVPATHRPAAPPAVPASSPPTPSAAPVAGAPAAALPTSARAAAPGAPAARTPAATPPVPSRATPSAAPPPAAPAKPAAAAPAPRPDPTEAFSRSLKEPSPEPTMIASGGVPERTVTAPTPGSGLRPGSILEVRLAAEGFDLVASEPGAHELGRSADAPLRVNHPTVSRKHARIILADDRGIAYLRDAGGANGTRLNGKAVEKLAPLSDGDRVGIGEVELKVTLKRV